MTRILGGIVGFVLGALIAYMIGLYAYGYATNSNLSGLVGLASAPVGAVIGAIIAYRLAQGRSQ